MFKAHVLHNYLVVQSSSPDHCCLVIVSLSMQQDPFCMELGTQDCEE